MKKIKASRKWKLLKEAISENVCLDKEFFLRGLCTAYTIGYILMLINPVINTSKSFIVNHERKKAAEEVNVEEVKKALEGTIVCGNLTVELDNYYKIIDGILYDNNGVKADLTDEERMLALVTTKSDSNTLKEAHLKESKIKAIILDISCQTDDFVMELPSTLEELSINNCSFITDLSLLPKYAPNLSYFSANGAIRLNNLDFIYSLKNLKYLSLRDSLAITPELLDYCENNGITIELNGREIENSQKIDAIIEEIIKPDMKDSEKINAVCHYVVDNIKYDLFFSQESNDNPIDKALSGRAVCISYADLTTALLNRLNINTYRVTSLDHAWNLVELDGEYFYIDPTNLDESLLTSLIYKIFSVSPYYMSNPNDTSFSGMKSPNEDEALIPQELIDEINRGVDEQTLLKKYGSSVGSISIFLLIIIAAILEYFGLEITSESISEAFYAIGDIIDSYNNLKDREKNNKSLKRK